MQDVVDVFGSSHLPTYTLELIKNKFYGYNLLNRNKSLVTEYNKFLDLKNKLSGSSIEIAYRMELRVNWWVMKDALEVLLSALYDSELLVFDSARFFEYTLINFSSLFDNFFINNNLKIDDIMSTMVSEYLLVKGYCNGTTNMHLLPKEFHQYARSVVTSKPAFPKFNFNFYNVLNTLNSNDKSKILVNLI